VTTTEKNLHPADLLAAASDGDAAAWSGLVDQYAELVWTIASRPELSRAKAEEASRLTWLRLAQRLGTEPADFAVGVWLARTARLETERCIAAESWSDQERPERAG
jgi:hypothetical protein